MRFKIHAYLTIWIIFLAVFSIIPVIAAIKTRNYFDLLGLLFVIPVNYVFIKYWSERIKENGKKPKLTIGFQQRFKDIAAQTEFEEI